jgi:hypothetical protein
VVAPAGNRMGAKTYLGSVGRKSQGKGDEVLPIREHHQTLAGIPIRSQKRESILMATSKFSLPIVRTTHPAWFDGSIGSWFPPPGKPSKR